MKAIIVFGDSIVHGRGESPNIGWVGRLKEFYESQDFFNCVFNLGIPGDSTDDLLKRFDAEVQSRVKFTYEGDRCIVIIAIGTNDTRSLGKKDNVKVSFDRFKKNVTEMVLKAKYLTNDVVIVGISPVDESLTNPFENTYFTNERIKKYNHGLRDIVADNKIQFIEIYDKLGNNWNKMLVDGVHPSSEGYEKMYEIIIKDLIQHGYIDEKRGDKERYNRMQK